QSVLRARGDTPNARRIVTSGEAIPVGRAHRTNDLDGGGLAVLELAEHGVHVGGTDRERLTRGGRRIDKARHAFGNRLAGVRLLRARDGVKKVRRGVIEVLVPERVGEVLLAVAVD